MSKNETMGFRPTDRQERLIGIYQGKHGNPDDPMKNSDAISELVDAGLEREFGGLQAWRALASGGFIVWATITLTWWWSGVGQFPVGFYLGRLSWIFGIIWVASLIIHLSDTTPLEALRKLAGRDPAPEQSRA